MSMGGRESAESRFTGESSKMDSLPGFSRGKGCQCHGEAGRMACDGSSCVGVVGHVFLGQVFLFVCQIDA
jgi:hypothetical protein